MPEHFEDQIEVEEPEKLKQRDIVRDALKTISAHAPQSQELESELVRDVDSSSFRGGQVTWSPKTPIIGEQFLNHRLGHVPKGMILICGTVPLQSWWATVAQRKRWTRERLYFFIQTHGFREGGSGTLLSGNIAVTITLTESVLENDRIIMVTSDEATFYSDGPLKVHITTVDPDDSARFISFDVTVADEGAASKDIEFNWSVLEEVTDDDEFVWQVI